MLSLVFCRDDRLSKTSLPMKLPDDLSFGSVLMQVRKYQKVLRSLIIQLFCFSWFNLLN